VLPALAGCEFTVEKVDSRGWSASSLEAAVGACKEGLGQDAVTKQPEFAELACRCAVSEASARWTREELTRRVNDPAEKVAVDAIVKGCRERAHAALSIPKTAAQ